MIRPTPATRWAFAVSAKPAAHLLAGYSALGANTCARALDQLDEPAIGAESHGFQIRVLDRHEDGHRLSVVRDNHGAVPDLFRIRGERCCSLPFFDNLHNGTSSPPIR